jgi:transposase
VLAAIIYMLRTGVPWRLLPARALGAGSPTTCWRRVRDWQQAGVWHALHRHILDQLRREAGSTCPAPAWTRSASGPSVGS